jgi:hypothetical protein
MLSVGGAPLKTFAPELSIKVAVPSNTMSFEIGVFDGDTGKDGTGAIKPSGGHWDRGSSQLEFKLFADPAGDGSGTTLIGQWAGNDPNPISGLLWATSSATMPDNDWWNVTVQTSSVAQAPSGNYFYELRVRLADPSSDTDSNFKLRTTGTVVMRPASWGFEGVARQPFNDGRVIYPEWDGVTIPPSGSNFWLTTATNYDGTWAFFLDVPTSTRDLHIWDGDFDFGSGVLTGSPSGVAIEDCRDSDDPNTPGSPLPPWANNTITQPESAKGSGVPFDNNNYDFYRRTPCVRYQVVDPLINSYENGNPSGNLEWEQFLISANPTANADHIATTDPLPGGLWQVKVSGLALPLTAR